jgi:hypothetical protein
MIKRQIFGLARLDLLRKRTSTQHKHRPMPSTECASACFSDHHDWRRSGGDFGRSLRGDTTVLGICPETWIKELGKKIASGGLWPVRLWAVGTWIGSGEVLLRRFLSEELLAWNVLDAGDAAGRRKVL